MEKLLTIKDVAEYLGLNEKTVYLFMYKKGLPYIKVGHRTIRFKKENIDEWLKQKTKTRNKEQKQKN